MNPRALLLWVGAVLLLSLGSEDPVYRVLTLLAAALMLVRARRRDAVLGPVVRWVGLAGLMAIVFNFLLSHTGQDVVVNLPGWLPAVGGQLTWEGAAYGVDVALGLTACLLAGTTLALATEPQQLVDALPGFLHRTGAALAATTTLLPRLRNSFLAVREAQSVRGWRPHGPRSWRAVAVPSVLSAIEGSVLLAEAMESRGFGLGRRTSVWPRPWTGADKRVAVVTTAAVAVFMVAVVLGLVGGWQPYPTFALPGVDWVPAAGGCLLIIAALCA
jgi:energy-coupling factor transport system permease protein